MPITYARYIHRKPEPDAYPAFFEDLEEDTVLLFDPVLEATAIGIGDLFRRLDAGIRATQVVVFRGMGDAFVDAIEKDSILPDNLKGKTVMALVGGGFQGSTAPVLRALSKFPPPPRVPRLDDLRQAELRGTLERAHAVFRSNEYHYELPSGLHAESFIRIGDALRSIYDVRRFSDWIAQHLGPRTVLVADTGSLAPLLLDLREYVHSRYGWTIELATLDRYPQNAVDVADAVAAVSNRPAVVETSTERAPNFVFLISVNSSGRLCKLFQTLGPPNSKIVVICQTGREPPPCQAILVNIPVAQWKVSSEGRCERCDVLPRIVVHPESYELLPSVARTLVVVGKDIAEAQARFWTIADEADAVRLHVDIPYQGDSDFRHFGIYLEMPKLARHNGFRAICIEQLRKIKSPDVVLIPDHQGTDVVADICNEVFREVPVFRVPGGRFSEELHDRLRAAKRILVADDAIVTGFTLINLRSELFRVTQQHGTTPEVHIFALVSRTSTEAPLLAIKRRYLGRAVTAILAGAELFLPDGGRCPWCRELRLLRSLRHRLKGTSLECAVERVGKLEFRGGLESPLLLVARDVQRDLKTLGSFFGELRQPAAFAAGVSATQRVVGRIAGLGGGVQLKAINLPMAIDSYYEGVLLAAIFRTVNAVHVRYPGSGSGCELCC